jgi:hypothetical protein
MRNGAEMGFKILNVEYTNVLVYTDKHTNITEAFILLKLHSKILTIMLYLCP